LPNARVAKDSGHDIHQDQPELVTEAIRQVAAAVRNPDTWYDLTSCCAKDEKYYASACFSVIPTG